MGRRGHDLSQELRQRIVRLHEWGWTKGGIAEAVGVTPGTVRLWVGRWERGEGLENRPAPKPERAPRRTPEAVEEIVCEMRRAGARSGVIAGQVGLHPATVTRILVRCGLGLVRERTSHGSCRCAQDRLHELYEG